MKQWEVEKEKPMKTVVNLRNLRGGRAMVAGQRAEVQEEKTVNLFDLEQLKAEIESR